MPKPGCGKRSGHKVNTLLEEGVEGNGAIVSDRSGGHNSDVLLCKMSKRQLHPWVVMMGMGSLVSSVLTIFSLVVSLPLTIDFNIRFNIEY